MKNNFTCLKTLVTFILSAAVFSASAQSAPSINFPPTFTAGASTGLVICENSDNSLNNLLTANDVNGAQTLTWTVVTAPSHGVLYGFPATAPSTGSNVTPSGLGYYSMGGLDADAFVIEVSDGMASAQITVNITVTQQVTWYYDGDGDGFFAYTTQACSSPGEHWSTSTSGMDCNDADASAQIPGTWYHDADGDDHFTESQNSCGSPGPGWRQYGSGFLPGDCNDADNTVWRSATLYRDADGDGYSTGQDIICYGATVPTGYLPFTNGPDCNDADKFIHSTYEFFPDSDGDGYGAGTITVFVCAVDAITPPAGYSTNNLDCAPADNTKHTSFPFYVDGDGDGYGAGFSVPVCAVDINTPPAGYSVSSQDCDDGDPDIHPGATEVFNGKDDNCNGSIDEGCTAPVITNVTDITSSRATVHWSPVPTATSYVTRRYPTGTTNYSYSYHAPITDIFKRLINMLPNTQYSVQVKSICGGGTDSSGWSPPFEFTTLSDCNPPSGLNVTNINSNRAIIHWTLPVSSPLSFQVQYRPVGTVAWLRHRPSSTDVSYVLRNLVPGKEYEWRMRSFCTDDSSAWVNGSHFTTLSSSAAIAASMKSKTGNNITVQVMPNPNKGNFTIQMQLPKDRAVTTLELFNSLGVKIWQADLGSVNGAVNKNALLENKLSTGVYLLMIERNDAHYTTKIVVGK